MHNILDATDLEKMQQQLKKIFRKHELNINKLESQSLKHTWKNAKKKC